MTQVQVGVSDVAPFPRTNDENEFLASQLSLKSAVTTALRTNHSATPELLPLRLHGLYLENQCAMIQFFFSAFGKSGK
jgi:hypothetical protein